MYDSKGRRRALLGTVLIVLALGLIQATSASAYTRAGTFSCRASTTQANGTESGIANPPFTPCRTDLAEAINTTIPLGGGNAVQVVGLQSYTQSNPNPTAGDSFPGKGHGGGAQSGIAGASIKLGTTSVAIGTIRSHVNVVCLTAAPGPPPVMSVLPSDVVVVYVNGTPISVDGPLTLPLGTSTLYLNRTIRTANTLTRRAIELDRLGQPPIILAESRVGYSGNPCTFTP